MTLGNFPQRHRRRRRRYGNCTCACHRNPNIKHIAPCCRPEDGKRLKLRDLRAKPDEKCGGPARRRRHMWEDQQETNNFGPRLKEAKDLPVAHGGCMCECHTYPNVKHIAPCCYPSDDIHLEEYKENNNDNQ